MALKIYKKFKHDGTTWISGHFYEFKYTSFENDPRPLIVCISAIKGTHPTSKKQWNLAQGINVNYLPRSDRKEFIKIWKVNLEKNKTPEFTWEIVKRRFPYMKLAIRRYLLSPKYYIRESRKIPIEDLEKEVVKSWHKDFSSSLKRKVASRLKSLFAGKRKRK